MVIVVLGILSAVALPKFVDLSDKAGTANNQGLAAAISAASAANLAAKKAGSPAAITINQANVCGSGVVFTLFQGPVWSDYGVVSNAKPSNCSGTAEVASCDIFSNNGTQYPITIYCAR